MRRNYDAKVLSMFDTIGSYFVDVFYNDMYLQAEEAFQAGKTESLTDAYRANIINYMRGINARPDLYLGVVKKLHEYYQHVSGFGATVFGEFENKMLSQFIPPEYYPDFTEQNKDNTLHDIIVKSVSSLGECVLERDTLRRVIDNHLDAANVALLQDQIVDIFITQREDYYSKFVNQISEANGNNTADRGVLKKLKSEYRKQTAMLVKMESDRDRAINMLQGCLIKIKELEVDNISVRKQLVLSQTLHAPTIVANDQYTSQMYGDNQSYSDVKPEPYDYDPDYDQRQTASPKKPSLKNVSRRSAQSPAQSPAHRIQVPVKSSPRTQTPQRVRTPVRDQERSPVQASPQRVRTPVQATVQATVQAPTKTRRSKSRALEPVINIMESIEDDNLADSDEEIIIDNLADVEYDDRQHNEPVYDTIPEVSPSGTDDEDESSEDVDPEELYRRQRAALSERKFTNLVDDPGFG